MILDPSTHTAEDKMQHNVKFGTAILFWQKSPFIPVKCPKSQLHINFGLYFSFMDMVLNYIKSSVSCPTIIVWRNTTSYTETRQHFWYKDRLPTENVGLCTWNVVEHLAAPLGCNCCNSSPCGCVHGILAGSELEIFCSSGYLNL